MEDTFEFQKVRIVGGDEGPEVGVMGPWVLLTLRSAFLYS